MLDWPFRKFSHKTINVERPNSCRVYIVVYDDSFWWFILWTICFSFLLHYVSKLSILGCLNCFLPYDDEKHGRFKQNWEIVHTTNHNWMVYRVLWFCFTQKQWLSTKSSWLDLVSFLQVEVHWWETCGAHNNRSPTSVRCGWSQCAEGAYLETIPPVIPGQGYQWHRGRQRWKRGLVWLSLCVIPDHTRFWLSGLVKSVCYTRSYQILIKWSG